jgi:hypothetical protein
MSVQNLFFARPAPKKPSLPLFSITGCGKRRQDVLPAPLYSIFHTSGLSSLLESDIRAGKLLVDPGHPQEELVGGRPHHRYIKACPRHPSVDRALQKNTHTADNHAKKLLEASFLSKMNRFQVMLPTLYAAQAIGVGKLELAPALLAINKHLNRRIQ